MTRKEKLKLIDRIPELTVDELMNFYVASNLIVDVRKDNINIKVKEALNKELKKRLLKENGNDSPEIAE